MTGRPGGPLPPPTDRGGLLRMVVHGGGHGLLGTVTGVLLLTLLLLPLTALSVWALARRRRRAGATGEWRTALADVGLVHGTLPWVWLSLLPGSRAGTVAGRTSLVPLQDLATMGPFQVVGNLLVLAALGLLAPLRFAALRSLPRVLALAAGCSTAIEVAQYVLRLDRVSSVDDVLLNTTGAGLAALASRRWWRPRRGGTTMEGASTSVSRGRPPPRAA